MGHFISDFKLRFRTSSVLTKLIYINVIAFIIIRLLHVLLILFNERDLDLSFIWNMPSSPIEILTHPWTIFTYMFVHYDMMHILFNMLWLYWFGKIFISFFGERQLGGLYLLGGLAGALFFAVAYNLFPYFNAVANHSYLIGASASVMAIVFAASFYKKNYEINLLFIGPVKLLYLALFTLLIDLFSITSSNAGGHIAHIGGALLGFWFAHQLRQGKDITKSINKILDFVANLFQPKKTKIHVSYKRTETDIEYNTRKKEASKQIDKILEKLKRSGYESLSKDEKKKLFDASK